MPFDLPESSLAGCWWLTNPAGRTTQRKTPEQRDPGAVVPKFLWKSLAVLVAELHQARVATVSKLSSELHGRLERNRELMRDISNTRLWRRHGPERWVEEFLALAAGRAGTGNTEPTAAELEELARHWDDNPPEASGPDDAAQWSAVAEALGDLRNTHWDDIRRERFSATPKGLFNEIRRSVAPWADHDLSLIHI